MLRSNEVFEDQLSAVFSLVLCTFQLIGEVVKFLFNLLLFGTRCTLTSFLLHNRKLANALIHRVTGKKTEPLNTLN